jgi:TetR/AcrR family transcriptional regulator
VGELISEGRPALSWIEKSYIIMKKKRKQGIYKAANKRNKILRAAEKEFANKGFAGARMKNIARMAGLDKATLYHYFRTKQDLYTAVLNEVTHSFAILSSKGIDHDTDPGDELTEYVGSIIDFLHKHRSFALILRREFTDPGRLRNSIINEALSPLIRQVHEWVRENIEKDELQEVDPEHTMYSLYEILFGYFTLNNELARLFFNKSPYEKDMLERRKAHITQMIRRLLVPEEMMKHKTQ